MKNDNPKIDRRAICISNNTTISALISSYFHNDNEYFSVFRLPVEEKSSSVVHNIIENIHSVFIKNRIVYLKPKYVIFAGLNAYQKGLFCDVSKDIVIEIDNIKNIENKLACFNVEFKGEVFCNKTDIISGLYLAKKTKKRLVINDSIENFNIKVGESKGLIVAERSQDLESIAMVNYAHAIDADIFFINKPDKQEIDSVAEKILKYKKEDNIKGLEKVIDKLNCKLRGVDYCKYGYVTFFTEGLPYGFGIKNKVPNSHVDRRRVFYFLHDNIFIEENNTFFHSALVFSVEEFSKTEPPDVIGVLKENKYVTIPILNKNATVDNFDNYVGSFPYDVLHICSHGGRLTGFYVIKKFKDRKGNEHTVELYEIPTFSSWYKTNDKDEPMIPVVCKMIPQKFNGIKWNTQKLRDMNYPQYVWDDYEKISSMDDFTSDVVRVPNNSAIRGTCHIECNDGQHQGNLHYVAGQNNPFIFNNTCSSGFDMATSFINAGVRAYIGTLWDIKDKNAILGARLFYKYAIKQKKTILSSFYKMSKKINNTKDANIYIFWGLHFSKLPRPKNIGDRMERIVDTLQDGLMSTLKFLYNGKGRKGSLELNKDRAKFIMYILSGIKEKVEKMKKE